MPAPLLVGGVGFSLWRLLARKVLRGIWSEPWQMQRTS